MEDNDVDRAVYRLMELLGYMPYDIQPESFIYQAFKATWLAGYNEALRLTNKMLVDKVGELR